MSTAARRAPPRNRDASPLWGYPSCRFKLSGRDRALSLAMCRGLRHEWDLDAAAERIVALHVDPSSVADALDAARRLSRRDPTIAAARAELALGRALSAMRAGEE
jgi:hypothetical protein